MTTPASHMTDEERRSGFSFVVIRELAANSKRVLGIVWGERRGLVLALLGTLIVLSASPFLISGSRGFLINELVRNIGALPVIPRTLLLALILFVAAGIIGPIFRTVQNYVTKLFWFFLEEKFELLILKKRGELDVAVHEDPEHNNLFNRVKENGTWRIRNFADRQFFVFENVLETLIAAAVIFTAEWWMLLIILVGTLPELITEARYGRHVWGIHMGRAEIRRRYWELQRHFEHLPSLTELKLFQNIKHFVSMIADLFHAFQTEERKNERRRLTNELVSLIFSQSALAFAGVWFAFEVLKGSIQIGTLTFFLASIGNLRQALSGLFMNLGRQYQDNLFVSDVFRLLDLKPSIKQPTPGIALDYAATPEIVFENISFKYPHAKRYALKNFSLTIRPGEKLAIVGANGAGKTTLVKLLCRFYDPQKGNILIGGHDLRTIDLEQWYRMLGILFQDYNNYHFLVKEAIGIGRTETPPALSKIRAAAEAGEADVFIREWERAYEQMLGKEFTGGVEPSIGQWQKLALARTFYRDPRVLILDEPTSAIDAESEAKIFEKLEQLPKDHTVILISHRFSTVRQANRICVIEGGSATEIGTHAALLARRGTYARLFRLQARGYQ